MGVSKVSVIYIYIYRLSFVTKWIIIFNRLFDFVIKRKNILKFST